MFVAVLPIVLLKLFVTCAQTEYHHSKATAKGVRKRASISAFDIWEDEMMDDRLFLQMLATLSFSMSEGELRSPRLIFSFYNMNDK